MIPVYIGLMADKKDDEGGGCPGGERDTMHLGPDLGNGFHPYVRHRPGCNVETGMLKAKPSHGNDEAIPPCDGIVRLKHSGPGPVFDVETLYERPLPPTDDVAGKAGPAMVATPAYRDGWDRIFGAKAVVGQA